MTEELRPCPVCGKRPQIRSGELNGHRFNKITCHTEVGCYGSNVDEATRTLWNSAWCWKEIDRLKKAAEEEFQRAEGKAEMKKWFQEEISRLKSQNEKMREALEEIRHDLLVCERDHGMTDSETLRIAEEALKGE